MWLENMRAPRERGRALPVAAGYQLVTCYEAGPFGYGLHRQLTALGVTNHVIRPRNWDDQHARVKTDRKHFQVTGQSLHAKRFAWMTKFLPW